MLKCMGKKVAAMMMMGTIIFSSQSVFAYQGEILPSSETEISTDDGMYQDLELFITENELEERSSVGLSCVHGVSQGSRLNVRSQPNTNASVVGSLAPGQHVLWSVFQGTTPRGWTYIHNPMHGYVSNQFLAHGNIHTGRCPA